MKTPSIVKLARDGAVLTPLQAVAGKLWLVGNDGAEEVRRGVEAYWTARGGDDAYWDLMSGRMNCDACGETYKLENLSICPNCFNTYCYRHGRTCRCGCAVVGEARGVPSAAAAQAFANRRCPSLQCAMRSFARKKEHVMASRRDVALGVAGLLAGCNSGREPPLPQSRALPTRTTRFPLRLVAGQRYPLCADGSPFLLHGDTAWSLIADASREDAVAYIEDRGERGFNTILVNLIEARFASNAPNNGYGEPPFLPANDFAAPNEAYFEHADFVLQTAREHGMLVLLAPAYLGAGGGDQGWYQQMRRNSQEQLRYYGRYVATRYAHYDNILWVAGGDFDPPDKRYTRAVSAGVRDILPLALQTAHCHRGVSAMQCWPGEDWLNVNSVYAGADAVEASLNQYATGAPFFFIEGRYEQAPAGDRATLRRQAYGPVLSGGFGHVYGNEDVWHYDGPGVFRRTTDWRSALDSPGARDMQRVWAFFSGLRWTLLEPDVAGRFLVDGRQQGEAMAATAVATDGSFAVVYAPTPRALSVDLTRLAAPLARARWFDPTSGAWSSAAHARDGDRARFHVQPTNAGGDGDWALLLET